MSSDTADKKPSVSADEGSIVSTIRNLWRYMWPADRPDLRWRVIIALGALVVSKVATTFIPFLYKGIVDSFDGSAPNSALILGVAIPILLVVAYGVTSLIDAGFQQLRDVWFASVGQNAVRQLAYEAFVHMHKLSLRFHLARRTGGLSRVIERGIKGIETIVRFTMLNIVPTMIEFVVTAIIFVTMFGISYLGVLLLVIWGYLVWTIKASNWRISIRRDMNTSDTDANSKAIDSLLNYETVKYFTNEEMEAKRYDAAMAGYERSAVRIWTSLGTLNFGQALIFYAGTVVILVMAAYGVIGGTLTVGDFVLLNTFLIQIYRPLNQIGFVYRELRQGLTDIEEMFRLLDQEPEIKDKPDAGVLDIGNPTIRFDNVTFHYDPDRPILKGVSFEVPAGKTVAIVGPTGAGKSTISRLLYRFYDVTGGAITIDGQDLRDVTQKSLRSAIGMVPQDTVLFNDTIGYNIEYGRPGASQDDIRAAANMAQVGRFIDGLPKGYDTPVGERGLKLSGGEKQRVAIARTILKAPSILILDEATSALDTHTEREIQSALDEVSRNRTTVVIAHRLSTVVNADEILVLRDGVVAERGNHIALLQQAGLYAQMWNRQREASEAEEQLLRTANDPDGFVKRGVPAAE
ncbi:ABC transporter ATP-binding protein/permease [Devosia ginsengisoli]|uniref:ABCB family ABC transporter ATP-binding protein/permease n=1 Tax=Devosia ginsengisoli TaxID=400770 RepID=UPI0026F2D2CD|nr:ABC transporter ATP-binding protein/permease [Devosia ginsengisoli]MCR6673181.1 ABC transporter ATP-binding protein/permease [Devosia ginsengisoli]